MASSSTSEFPLSIGVLFLLERPFNTSVFGTILCTLVPCPTHGVNAEYVSGLLNGLLIVVPDKNKHVMLTF